MLARIGLCLAAALLASAARSDVWDLGGDSDNDAGSDNEIVHGLSQVHDLGARAGGTIADVDWYAFRLPESRSFEIRVDGLTADLVTPAQRPDVDLVAGDGTTVVATADLATNYGSARSLRVYSDITGGFSYGIRYIRVSDAECALACTGDDQYRIRAFDTTMALPRFNNTNGQVTVLILQNPSDRTITFHAGAFMNSGILIGTIPGQIPAHGTAVVNLATVNNGGLLNQSGSLVIRHDGPYLGLTGKGVSVEPATGFTFDTAITPAPR